jgi:hypothetical protein
LRPDGVAYFSEPVYWGDFNTILSLFNDEQAVRQLAFEHLKKAVDSGLFALHGEVFFEIPGTYANWEIFEQRFLQVTHTQHDIDEALYERIKSAFLEHMTPEGAHFLKPQRVDMLRRCDGV